MPSLLPALSLAGNTSGLQPLLHGASWHNLRKEPSGMGLSGGGGQKGQKADDCLEVLSLTGARSISALSLTEKP